MEGWFDGRVDRWDPWMKEGRVDGRMGRWNKEDRLMMIETNDRWYTLISEEKDLGIESKNAIFVIQIMS